MELCRPLLVTRGNALQRIDADSAGWLKRVSIWVVFLSNSTFNKNITEGCDIEMVCKGGKDDQIW